MEGFLKYVCTTNTSAAEDTITYKCHNSDEMYEGRVLTQLCSVDPHFYQTCKTKLYHSYFNKNELLCGVYLCDNGTDIKVLWKTHEDDHHSPENCNGVKDCENTDVDEVGCSATNQTTLPSGNTIPSHKICDDKCDDGKNRRCEDEANCNGYTYGMYCDQDSMTNTMTYVPPFRVCDGYSDCTDGKDEANCSVNKESEPSCPNYMGEIVPIHNFTKCHPDIWYTYCIDFVYGQTNCTDPGKVALACRVNGSMTTVSRYVVCLYDDNEIQICDDNIESHCVEFDLTELEMSCKVHKHSMCDGIPDCEFNLDETNHICNHMTKQKCKRRVGKSGELPIPIAWLEDGIEDCIDGSDEMKVWPTCGTGNSLRFVTSNDSCKNVYVCPWDKPWHVELDDLCDGLETCGNENKVCSESLGITTVFTTVHTTDKGLSKHLSYCIKGMKKYENFALSCISFHSIEIHNQNVFGMNTTTITFPRDPQNCDHVFGEMYVYLSCINNCINSPCPLSNMPLYDECPAQNLDKIATVVNNQYLTFVTESFENIYTNRYFVCDNKFKCIDYSKVCDLVDDCEDGSDEEICTNHFKCNSTGRYIPKTKICDKSFDCLDLSDECSAQCSEFILKGSALKGISWTIGSLATVTNIIIISKNAVTLKRCRTTVALLNKSLIMMISFGDLFVGVYLFIVSIYDGIVFKESYCENQINWITSSNCSIIGVISTLGSQVSLFAMCVLSLTRIVGICNSMKIPGEITWRKIISISIGVLILIFSSFIIAAIPILNIFEDFFVNGIKYPEELRVFIGTPNKQKVLAILEAYYGRMKRATLSWKMINKMVGKMYSHDFDYPDHTAKISKVDFYGNDGVCLFKYFVNNEDPQRMFVWTILATNFLCFISITFSYIMIGYFSWRSSKSLTQSGVNQQISQRNQKMNRKITIIITTDFLCWVPFIVICVLHSTEVLDATPWYSLFSIILLPINSVINPLIYDDTITSLIISKVKRVGRFISNSRVYQMVAVMLIHGNLLQPTRENIELTNIINDHQVRS